MVEEELQEDALIQLMAADNWGDSCPEYANNLSWCGNYNNDAFQSEKMCCACGGGEAGCTDTANGAADNWGDSCPEYANNLNWCGKYNNDVFQSEVMCCACKEHLAGRK